MLKVFLGFAVSLVVLLTSAYVPGISSSSYATSAHVLMTRIQAGGVGAATQEFVVLYNNTNEEVDITGWCLTNKGSLKFACFSPDTLGQKIYLPAFKYATAVSETFAATLPDTIFGTVYSPLNQSSGSITGTSDTISLLDQSGVVIDRYAWSVSAGSGMHLSRIGSGDPKIYVDSDTVMDWAASPTQPLLDDETEIDEVVVDLCPNIAMLQAVIPQGMQLDEVGDCIPEEVIRLDVTELLPNPKGSDAGLEFIELFNPNDRAVLLSNYQLYVGPQLDVVYNFPAESFIEPHSYKVFSNIEIPFSLLNTSSRVRLSLKNGAIASDVSLYENPKDNQSWSYIEGVWMYSSNPTPGAENSLGELVIDEAVSSLVSQPCAANQYRSPETNRCRLLSSSGAAVTPCKDGQYRSEETNRCRTIASDAKVATQCEEGSERNPETGRCRKVAAVTGPAPCKEGQERNPDTNRCRNVAKMPSADYGVLGAKTDGGGSWYVIAAIGGVLLIALAYAVWEWHVEIGKFMQSIRSWMIRFVRIHK